MFQMCKHPVQRNDTNTCYTYWLLYCLQSISVKVFFTSYTFSWMIRYDTTVTVTQHSIISLSIYRPYTLTSQPQSTYKHCILRKNRIARLLLLFFSFDLCNVLHTLCVCATVALFAVNDGKNERNRWRKRRKKNGDGQINVARVCT